MLESGTAATYLPESMIIGVGPDLQIFAPDQSAISFPTGMALGYFFHEYVHYLHNISTASGIAVFANTLELWRCFRLTMEAAGHSAGSAGLAPDQKAHLADLLAYLTAVRWRHDPELNHILSPHSVTIHSFVSRVDASGGNGALHTTLVCEAEIFDQGGQVEPQTITIGTLELLEQAAWLLEKRLVEAVAPLEAREPPKIFPYRIVEAVARFAVPGIDENGVLACVLAALQSSDAVDGLLQVLSIAAGAIEEGRDPVDALRRCAEMVIERNSGTLEMLLASLEREFNGNGVMARAIRNIIGAALLALAARAKDPFFELAIVADLGSRAKSIEDILRSIPSCAVLQKNPGSVDYIQRDFLLSFLPLKDVHGFDPEDGLRIVHAIFHYIGRHRRLRDLVETEHASSDKCPFYTSCNLPLRIKDRAVCKTEPWKSADWPEWDNAACWYATGVRITRPPPLTAA